MDFLICLIYSYTLECELCQELNVEMIENKNISAYALILEINMMLMGSIYLPWTLEKTQINYVLDIKIDIQILLYFTTILMDSVNKANWLCKCSNILIMNKNINVLNYLTTDYCQAWYELEKNIYHFLGELSPFISR